jgi:hypothetical protein
LGDGSRYSSETLLTEIRQAAGKGARDLHIFLHGEPSEWEIMDSLCGHLYRWKELYTNVVLIISDAQENHLSEMLKEDLWVLHRLGIKIAVIDAHKRLPKNSGCMIAQTLWADKRVTFACSNSQAANPVLDWMNDAENILIYANEYPVIPISRYLEENRLKPKTGQGDVEVEILEECNGALNQLRRNSGNVLQNSINLYNNTLTLEMNW